MFEHSLLLDHDPGKKTGALAASLSIQTLAVGALLMVPLIFSDRLTLIRPLIPLSLPLPPPRAPEPVQVTAMHSARTNYSQTRPIFHPPPRLNSIAQIMNAEPIDLEPPAFVTSGDSVPGSTAPGFQGGTGLSKMFELQKPPVRVVEKPKETGGPVRATSEIQAAKLVRKVVPPYPPLARQARISGTVRLIGVISKEGTIQQLQVVSGHPLLVNAALNAVRQWIYKPTLLNQQAVEVIAPIDVIFTLSQ